MTEEDKLIDKMWIANCFPSRSRYRIRFYMRKPRFRKAVRTILEHQRRGCANAYARAIGTTATMEYEAILNASPEVKE